MRGCGTLFLALALAPAMLAASGSFTSADARMSLSQCISKRDSCRSACIRANGPPGQLNPWTLEYQYCLNKCESNHAACVNFSMGGGMADRGPGQGRPPRNTNVVAPLGGGLLDPSPGFNPQAPAATGTPTGSGGRASSGRLR